MRFLVKSIVSWSGPTRVNAFLKTWKPQYFRSAEEVAENKDSVTHVRYSSQ